MRKFEFIDPGTIMGVVVALIILAVGVFAFFITINEISSISDSPEIKESINHVTETGNDVFNIIGIVLIVGAIMAIVGVVFNYISPSESLSHSQSLPTRDKEIEESLEHEPLLSKASFKDEVIESFGEKETFKKKKEEEDVDDYRLIGIHTPEESESKIENLKDTGYWVKTKHVHGKDSKNIAIYISKWTKYEKEVRGRPKWRR